MQTDYRDDMSVEENQARALFAIAAAIHKLLYGLKYSVNEGMSLAEAIGDGAEKIAEAVARLEPTE